MKILITGVNGFLGRNITKYLVKRNYEVIGTSMEKNFILKNKIKYIQADFLEKDFIKNFLEKISEVDVIIHCGALINNSNHDLKLVEANCFGIFNIVELAKNLKCKKIIYMSSIQVIGDIKTIPIKEEHSLNPKTLYHTTKLFGENYLKNINEIDKIIFRLSSPIGEDMPENKIFKVFIKNSLKNEDIMLYGQGKRIQNYIDVIDIAKLIEQAIESKIKFGVYNLASPNNISNIELAETCKKVLNSSSKIIFNNMSDPEENNKWIIDISKIKSELNFNDYTKIEDSILRIKNQIKDKK